jgi:hypothetical protein
MIARAPQVNRKRVLSSRLGLVSVPEGVLGGNAPQLGGEAAFDRKETQDLLRHLGVGLGLTVLPPTEDTFPEPDPAPAVPVLPEADLDPAVRLTLESLDAVWMQGEDVVAVFVIEPRAMGWEGLRRLVDLLALHPKLKAPLYAVTTPAVYEALGVEVHRPAYRLLKKPLADQLRLLDWDRLKTEVDQLGERVRYLKPEFLEGIADRLAPPAED